MRADTAKTNLTVIVLAGVPGAGKTTLARAIVKRTGWSYLSRDDVRMAMFQPCAFTLEEKNSAFQAMLLALRTTLLLNRSCIVEGMPFSRVGELESVMEISSDTGARLHTFLIDVPVEVAMSRVARDNPGEVGRPDALDRVPQLVRDVAARMRSFSPAVHQLDGRLPTDALLTRVIEQIVDIPL